MSKKIIHLSQSVLTFLPKAIGKFAAWFVVAMIILTGIVVFCRYVLNIGIISLQEMTIYLHGSLFLLCTAYALGEDEHVPVSYTHSPSPRDS